MDSNDSPFTISGSSGGAQPNFTPVTGGSEPNSFSGGVEGIEENLSSGGMVVFNGGTTDLSGKKKRGRPRKYDSDGNLNPAYKVKTPPVGEAGDKFSLSGSTGPKRGRGKHSGNGQMLAPVLGELFNIAGGDFTPHVLNVKTNEDIPSNIISLCSNGLKGVCVLSANGMVSNVTLRQPGSSGGLLTYEGRFEILSLKGSFAISGNGVVAGGLSISLASPDGRVLGGRIVGLLLAASPIQMVVASFVQNASTKAQKKKQTYAPRTTPVTPASAIHATPVSEPTVNASSYPVPMTEGHMQSYGESHNNQTHGNEAQNNENNISVSEKPSSNSSSDSGEWNIPEPNSVHRAYPDINVSLLVD